MTGKRRQPGPRGGSARLAAAVGAACLLTATAAVASVGRIHAVRTTAAAGVHAVRTTAAAGAVAVTGDLRVDSLLAQMTLVDKLRLLTAVAA